MANALYVKAKEDFLKGYTNLTADTIKVALVDTGTYTVNINTDHFYSTISSAVVGTPVALSGKSITNGVFDAGDTTFTAVTGSTVEALVIYRDSGTAANSNLIAYIDTATGLPVTPNGGDILVQWDNGSNKIFAIT
jgi:hypothetical protein